MDLFDLISFWQSGWGILGKVYPGDLPWSNEGRSQSFQEDSSSLSFQQIPYSKIFGESVNLYFWLPIKLCF